VFAFREDLWILALGLFGRGPDPRTARRLIWLLALGSIPAAIAGIALGDFFEERFDDPLATCFELLLTAFILLGAEWIIRKGEGHHPIDGKRAGVIGVAQAVAILPGISRSGATIAAGLVTKVSREDAARYSFLLAIPAIAGAVVTQVPDVVDGEFQITGPVIAGFLASMIVGWIAIEWLLRYVRTHSFVPFAVYLIIAAPIAALIIELR
jgi:undecaprenyl-diphosphatase